MKFAIVIASLALALAPNLSEAADAPTAPAGWTTGAARDELRPSFRHEAKGGPAGQATLVIEWAGVALAPVTAPLPRMVRLAAPGDTVG